MPEQGNYGGESASMPPQGEHPCILADVEYVPAAKKYQSEETEPQWKWVFETVRWRDPQTGKPGRIWLRTGINYGNNKARLTAFLQAIFDRALTREEFRRIDFDRMTNTVRGYVTVLPFTREDGSKGVRYSAFRRPDNIPAFPPTVFFAEPAPKPKEIAAPLSRSSASTIVIADVDDFDDPFEPLDSNGIGANAPF